MLLLLCLAALGAYAAACAIRCRRPRAKSPLAGLAAPVEVLRDRHGIPHIFAASLEDAHFALGFVHAQDRLWQMEMNRRIGSGRLAEMLGPAALETDRFMRTLGLRRVAERKPAALRRRDAPPARRLCRRRQRVPRRRPGAAAGILAARMFRPNPGRAVDSIVWTKVMALDLGGNWRSELLRMRLSQTLPLERIQEFLPPYPGDAAPRSRI